MSVYDPQAYEVDGTIVFKGQNVIMSWCVELTEDSDKDNVLIELANGVWIKRCIEGEHPEQ